jgi:hypothetical protein
MNATTSPARGSQQELSRVIEPLASYICAANRPRAALESALAILLSEVRATNRSARAHVRGKSGQGWG